MKGRLLNNTHSKHNANLWNQHHNPAVNKRASNIMTRELLFLAEPSRARSAHSGASWVRKYGNLCFQEILFLRESSVRTSTLHVSRCKMTHFNTICVKLGIGHPCCDQLTAVKKGYPLTSVTWLHRRPGYTTPGSDVFFKVTRWPVIRFWWRAQVSFLKGRIQFALCLRPKYK